MLIKLIWAVIASGIAVVLFYFARRDTLRAYGFDAWWPWVLAYVFALVCAGLWIWILSSLMLIWPIVYGASLACSVVLIPTGYLSLADNVPGWLPEWMQIIDHDWWPTAFCVAAITGYIGLLAYSSQDFWGG